jgi:hypothetical protein
VTHVRPWKIREGPVDLIVDRAFFRSLTALCRVAADMLPLHRQARECCAQVPLADTGVTHVCDWLFIDIWGFLHPDYATEPGKPVRYSGSGRKKINIATCRTKPRTICAMGLPGPSKNFTL